MDITTSLAASRLVAQQRAMDITANNIANSNTPGYRTERVQFSDWIDQQPNTASPPGGHAITYTQDRATYRESQPGTLTHTANPFDLALTGDGYFTVNTRNGPRLTRDGRFTPMPDGTLADGSGNAVLDTTGKPIVIAPTDTQISVAGDGTITSENGEVGKIGIVRPTDAMKLQAEGATNFVSDTPTTPVTAPGIVQGAIEGSNVQPVLEVTRMMDDVRQFQFVTQLVQAEGDRQQQTIDKLLPTGSGS
ncbi:flagellar hook-basal body complex protein [Acidisphaera sp. S103]|uniref:flagellar hook-basal body complex protein n=1 Tax=Acidisphaera sp. S103 TaxID=1747223 RepID=UPI00131BEB58|nr:flagellar hook-basal body complex protein [Acidisphaera sp. S103]